MGFDRSQWYWHKYRRRPCDRRRKRSGKLRRASCMWTGWRWTGPGVSLPLAFHSFGADGLVYQTQLNSICIYSIKPCRWNASSTPRYVLCCGTLMIRHLCCEGTSQITIIQRLCFAAIGRTCLFGVREPTSPHPNPSFDRKDSVLSVYASLTLISVITISRWCFGHADLIIFILCVLSRESLLYSTREWCQERAIHERIEPMVLMRCGSLMAIVSCTWS